mmetsp:Transcript_24158/g.50229  ORF Transcript_24158/g.50229 Transcript_24158/m.50229 type:complete len:228 (-) Transcript_24158:154-837(-)
MLQELTLFNSGGYTSFLAEFQQLFPFDQIVWLPCSLIFHTAVLDATWARYPHRGLFLHNSRFTVCKRNCTVFFHKTAQCRRVDRFGWPSALTQEHASAFPKQQFYFISSFRVAVSHGGNCTILPLVIEIHSFASKRVQLASYPSQEAPILSSEDILVFAYKFRVAAIVNRAWCVRRNRLCCQGYSRASVITFTACLAVFSRWIVNRTTPTASVRAIAATVSRHHDSN